MSHTFPVQTGILHAEFEFHYKGFMGAISWYQLPITFIILLGE